MKIIKTFKGDSSSIDFSKITSSLNTKFDNYAGNGCVKNPVLENFEELILNSDSSDNQNASIKNSNLSVNLGQYRILRDGEVGYPLGKKVSDVNNSSDELARAKEISKKSRDKESSLLEVKSNFNIRISLDGMDQKWIEFAESRTGVPMPNCYTYARARISEILNVETTISDVPIGHAGNLWEIHNDDFIQSNVPKLGALMIWKNKYDPANSFGHVAVCEKVNTDETVEWSQSNYGGPMFQYEFGDPSIKYIDNSNLQFMGYLVSKDLK